MNKLTLKNLDIKGKRVLMRVDFNVPLNAKGEITDDSRIRAALPSIQYVLQSGASLVLMSHLGRPKKTDPKLSLIPCAKRLEKLLRVPVQMAPDCVGPAVEKLAQHLQPGQILMLENVRFHVAEEEPEQDPHFAASLSRLGDVYVNDAFGTAHRAHASTALVAKAFPGKAAAGFLMEQEINHLAPLLHNPPRPFYAIIGGAKVSTKTGVIHNLLKLIDGLFLGGAMTFTFMKAQGIEIGNSPCEEEELRTAREILHNVKQLYMPIDLVIADRFSPDANTRIIPVKEGIPSGWQGMDIGPATIQAWTKPLQEAATVFWNGPVGVFEMAPFATGTNQIAQTLAHSKAKVIVGGGDSVAAIQQMGLGSQFSHLSTGGGAALEFLEYGHLPGIDALSNI